MSVASVVARVGRSPYRAVAVAGLLALVLAAAAAWRLLPAGPPPDLVLVVMDTVRADRLHAPLPLGTGREVERLDALARRAQEHAAPLDDDTVDLLQAAGYLAPDP